MCTRSGFFGYLKGEARVQVVGYPRHSCGHLDSPAWAISVPSVGDLCCNCGLAMYFLWVVSPLWAIWRRIRVCFRKKWQNNMAKTVYQSLECTLCGFLEKQLGLPNLKLSIDNQSVTMLMCPWSGKLCPQCGQKHTDAPWFCFSEVYLDWEDQ